MRIGNGDRNVQKRLRRRLRTEYGFYISDFDDSRQGFARSDFDALVSSRTIHVDG